MRCVSLFTTTCLLGLVAIAHSTDSLEARQHSDKAGEIEIHQDPEGHIELHHDADAIENAKIHTDYAAPIGVDTQYLTKDGPRTKWIGINTEYLTKATKTTKVGGKTTQTVIKQQLAVATATKAADGLKKGDVTVLIPEALRQDIDKIVKEAHAACAAAKLRKRISSCVLNRLTDVANSDSSFELVSPAEWEGFALEMSESAPEVVGAAVQVLKTQAARNKMALLVAGAATVGAIGVGELVDDITAPLKYLFDSGSFGGADKDSDKHNDPEKKPTKTSSACDPKATADEKSPTCKSKKCKGKQGVCTAKGKYKGCQCLDYAIEYVDNWGKDWVKFQQDYLLELVTSAISARISKGDEMKTKTKPPAAKPTLSDDKFCKGVLITDDCIAGRLPEKPNYSGTYPPVCMRADGSKGARPRLNSAEVSKAARKICKDLVDDKYVLRKGDKVKKTFKGLAEGDRPMHFVIKHDMAWCPEDKSMKELDFRKLGEKDCQKHLGDVFNEHCHQDETWEAYDGEFNIMGGFYGRDCARWVAMGF